MLPIRNRAILNPCFWLCLSLSLAFVGARDGRAGEVYGRATEKDGVTPVSGVIVELYSDNAKIQDSNTGKDGRYTLPIEHKGKYRITFSSKPDLCIRPFSDKTFQISSERQEENVTVVHVKDNSRIISDDLFDAIKNRTTGTGGSQAQQDIVALATSGADTNILKMVATRLAQENPQFLAPETATITDFDNNILKVQGKYDAQPKEFKISDETTFVDPSGKSVASLKSSDLLFGKTVTIFSAPQGAETVSKSVVVSTPLDDLLTHKK
jgi:hypothetical protein